MKIVVKIISYLFTFLLMVTMLTALILGITTKTILDKEYVLAKLEETNYYDKVYSDLLAEVEDYVEQSGLEGFDLQNILKKEQVQEDIKLLFSKLYNGDVVTVKQEDVAQQLEKNLKEEIQRKGITLTTMEKREVDTVINTVAKVYTNEVSYGSYSSYLDSLAKLILAVDEALFVVGIILYAAPFIIMAIILLFHYNQFRVGLKYIGIATVANGGLMLVINLFTKISLDLQNFFFLNQATSDFIIKLLTEILSKITMTGMISAGVGLLLIIIGATYRNKDDDEEDNEDDDEEEIEDEE